MFFPWSGASIWDVLFPLIICLGIPAFALLAGVIMVVRSWCGKRRATRPSQRRW